MSIREQREQSKAVKWLSRFILGIGELVGGNFGQAVTRGWFKQLEYAALTGALFAIGSIHDASAVIFDIVGVLSLVFLLHYSWNAHIKSCLHAFVDSKRNVNERIVKRFGVDSGIEYPDSPRQNAMAVLLLLFILDLITLVPLMLAVYYFMTT
jgi:hypothetical protein